MHFLRRGQREADHADHGGQGAALLVGVDPEAADAGQGEGKIIVPGLQKLVHVPAACQRIDVLDHPGCVLGHQAFALLSQKLFILPVGKGTSCDDKEIGSAKLGGAL